MGNITTGSGRIIRNTVAAYGHQPSDMMASLTVTLVNGIPEMCKVMEFIRLTTERINTKVNLLNF